MKRIISFMLAFAVLLSLSLTAKASTYNDFLNIDDKSQYDMDAYYQELWINYETNTSSLWNYVCGDQCNTYVQIANHFEGNGWYEFVTRWTEQDLTKERYVEILVNLMTLMDYTTHEMIEEQVNADTLKTFGDYARDVSEILLGTVTLHSTFGSRITEPMKRIATAVGLTSGAADLTVDTIEAYQYLDWTLQTYEHHDLFLSSIIQNTDDEMLRDAAIELSDIVNKAFYCKINAVSDVSESTAKYIGKDIFFDAIVLDQMLKDASILDLSESDLAILDLIKNTYSVFTTSLSYIQDWSVFISDMLGGSSDVMNRYNEMRALTTIREALIKQVEFYRSNIKEASNYVEIGKLCVLMRDLVCVNYRGEYCVHEMLVHDGQAFSLVVKWNGEAMTYDEVFEKTKLRTSAYIDAIDSIFPDPELYRLKETTEPVHEYASFTEVIENTQSRIGYGSFSENQKEFCRGDFFEIDGKKALVLMYHTPTDSDLTPGYYVGLWIENSNGAISCLTDQLIEEAANPDDAYVTVNIRKIDGKMYINPYVRTANNSTDISKNQYYLIGDELVLEYDLYSEENNYYLSQEQIEQSTFYSTQDKLNIRTFVLELNPNWSEGRPPQGYTFEELLAQLGDETEVDTEETQGQSVSYEDGFVGNETVEQLRKSIVGSWGAEGSVVSDYDFNSDGTCYWSFDKQTEGTYQIRDDKMLVITFPWMDDRYFWTEETYEEWRSHSSQDCWYMTDAGVLILNGVSYYRDGKVIKDYNTEGGLLATISGAWVLDDFMEYRFFMDGTFEENTVFVSNGMLLNRVDLDTGSIEIIDDTHAKLWNVAESFGELSGYTELVYDPETDTLCIGGSNNVYHRADYLD